MSDDLRRLSLGSDLGAALLRSAKEDRVPEGAAARAVGAAILAGATVATPAGAGVLHRLGTLVSAPAAKVTIGVATLVLAVGTLVASLELGPFANKTVPSALPPAPKVMQPVAPAVTAPSPETSGALVDVPSLRLEELPRVPSAPVSGGVAAPKEAPSAAPPPSAVATEAQVPNPAPPSIDSSLAEEVRALDGVRSALRAGDGQSALAQLAAYEAKFPKKQLGQEAAVLRERAKALQAK
ncbi:MAG: hypothetical protein U0174_26720 [Polyangiaceae bacterium]